MKGKKRSGRVTIIVNILFIVAICAIGWLIADHLIQDRKSAELSDDLWQQVAVTRRPEGQDTEKTAEPAVSSATAVPAQDDHEAGTGTDNESVSETGAEQEKENASGAGQQDAVAGTTELKDNEAGTEAEAASPENKKADATGTETPCEAGDAKTEEKTAASPATDAGTQASADTDMPAEERPETGEPALTGAEISAENRPEAEGSPPEGAEISAENGPETEEAAPAGAKIPPEDQPETEKTSTADTDIPADHEGREGTEPEQVSAEKKPGDEQTGRQDDPDIPEQIDFDALRQISADAAAWLYAPDIGLNQAVMHTDNNEFYLTHMADGTQNKAGALFIDCRNAEGLANRNTIIYGHSMKNQSMFGKLKAYEDEEYCREHPVLYLYLPEGRFRLEIVAAVGTPDLSDYYRIPVSRERWEKLLQDAMSETAYDFGVPVTEEDRFVTLSTCAYDYQDERWIVICRVDDPQGILPPLAE